MSPSTPVLPFDVSERTLPNGLRVIVVPTGFPDLVSLQIAVQTGSRNEVEQGLSGFAHFFEHMMFRGTAAFPPERYQRAMTLAGARANAYTTDDYTNYHATFARADLAAVIAMEADRFQRLDYAPEAFKTEARAVLGEYNKNAADPGTKLYEVMRAAAYERHTYKHTTMGFLADIEDMPNQFAYSRTFFDRWYRPEYTTVIVAGDVTADQVLPLIEQHWGGWKRGSFRVEVPQEPAPRGPRYVHVAWEDDTLPLLELAFHGPAFGTRAPDHAALDALLDLSFGPTSEIYAQLVEREQKADQLGGWLPANVDPGLVHVSARLRRASDAVEVRDRLLAVVARARDTLVDAVALREAQSHARYAFARRLDNTDAIASVIARYAHFERSYTTVNAYFARYAALTPEDLRAAARRYLTDAGLIVATLSREPLATEIAVVPAIAFLASSAALPARPPAAPAAPTVSASAAPVAAVQPPALRVVRQPGVLPQLCIKLAFDAGSAHDPPGKEGLAALTAAMITEGGSRERGIEAIKRALFPIAGGFWAHVDKELATLTAAIHRDNWDAFADVVLPQLTAPGFRAEDFDRLRQAQRNALLVDLRGNNEEELGKEYLQARVFAGTPYGHPYLGTLAGLDAITLEDVRAFARRAFTTGNLTVGLAGDAPPAVEARLRRELAALAGPALPAPAGIVGHRCAGMHVEIIEKDTRSTAISFGHPIAVTRAHPDFVALALARTWLGEHRSSMSQLYQRIREVRGLNYGDYAYIEAFPGGMFRLLPPAGVVRRAQLFEIWLRPVLPQHAQMALRLAVHELERLINRGMDPESFEATRAYLSKNVAVVTATQDARLGFALDSAWYGTAEYVELVRAGLAELTLDAVNRAVRTHLSARDLRVVMVARDAAALRETLLADAASTLVYDSPKADALLAEDRAIGARKLAIQGVTVVPLDEVFAGSD